jgi:transmembrane sensor
MKSERLHTAGDWLLRLQSEQLDQNELAEWVEWYGSDAANRLAFEEIQSSYESLRQLPTNRRELLIERIMGPAAEDLLRQDARRSAAPDSRQPGFWDNLRASFSSMAWWSYRERVFAACVGACIAFTVSFGLWYVSPANRQASDVQTYVYRTDRAKHEVVDLTDGSQLRIGAKSSVFVSYTEEGRYLVLEGGEAFFKVAHDTKRPFVVQAGSISIRAVGTEFSVRRAAERVMVTVREGAVDVVPQLKVQAPTPETAATNGSKDKVRVGAGERVTLSTTETNLAVMAAEPGAALAWQNGRLEFVDEPLRAVVATINRYSDRELILTDAQLGDMSFTGTVYEGRVDEWLQALQEVFPIRVVTTGSDAILLSPVGNRT